MLLQWRKSYSCSGGVRRKRKDGNHLLEALEHRMGSSLFIIRKFASTTRSEEFGRGRRNLSSTITKGGGGGGDKPSLHLLQQWRLSSMNTVSSIGRRRISSFNQEQQQQQQMNHPEHHDHINNNSSNSSSNNNNNNNNNKNNDLVAEQLSWDSVSRAMIGNTIIATLKFAVYFQSNSSAMFAEAIHTLADMGNQGLLLAGLHEASKVPDKKFTYGYGRASYFWALLSALGMFWTGAGIACLHGVYQLTHPPEIFEISRTMVGVLGVSFLVDGYVLTKTLSELHKTLPQGRSFFKHVYSNRDPFVLAVVMEDTAACAGLVIAGTGLALTHITSDVFYDSVASISVGVLLGAVSLHLVRMNHKFLVGQAVDDEIIRKIRRMLQSRKSIDSVYDVQTQWVGPNAFAFKAGVDFSGHYISQQLMYRYRPLFENANLSNNMVGMEVLMANYAEEVTRLIEREVKDIEVSIRREVPQAAFIELEPVSEVSEFSAIDGSRIEYYDHHQ